MKNNTGLRKNDIIRLDVTGFSSEGSGVGHYNGQAVFVAGAAAGDTVECVIIKAKNNYAVGKLTGIINASPDRVEPDCPVFPRCGGCTFRHISYDAELRLKEQRVKDAFSRIGHIDLMPEDIVGASAPDRYRNKAQYPAAEVNGRLYTGFYSPFSHRVTDCKNCLLQPGEFTPILKTVSRWAEKYKIPVYNEASATGLLRHIYLRRGFITGEIMVCLVINGERVFKEKELVESLLKTDGNIKTILLNTNTEKTNVVLGEKNRVLYGPGYIEDVLCSKRFRISPLSFWQVNREQAEKLYEKAAEFAITPNTQTLIDLYCGTGTIGLTMAERVKRLIGVEIVEDAVKDAKTNAELNGISNAEFICADASKSAALLKEKGVKPDTVILDPPRKGCAEELIKTVSEMSPERIVYISCDPATLARDCERFDRLGYSVNAVVPFDLFPRTAHVETVALMARQYNDKSVLKP